MNNATARIIVNGLIPDGFDVSKLTPKGRQEVRDAIDALLDDRWRRCPSTHCERWQECRSPHECSVRG